MDFEKAFKKVLLHCEQPAEELFFFTFMAMNGHYLNYLEVYVIKDQKRK